MGALSFFRESIYSQEYALRDGFLQKTNPRAKAFLIILLLVGMLFVKHLVVLLILYAVCLATAFLSKIDLGVFLKRTWIFVPLFSLFIAIPAVFNTFTPGDEVIAFVVFGQKCIVTKQGLSSAGVFIMRVLTSVSFVILLTMTTRHSELLKTLRAFKVPQIFVMTLSMCYRYIYLFAGIIQSVYVAIKSRTGGVMHYRKGQKVVAWKIASLWQRSYKMNEDVHNAMLSRGYRGEQ